jgi:hypothetical protein
MARSPDPARHQGNRPHEGMPVHPIHRRPAAAATPGTPPCAHRPGRPAETHKATVAGITPPEIAQTEQGKGPFQSSQHYLHHSFSSDRQRAFPIDTAQPPRLPPREIFQRGPRSRKAERPCYGPHQKIFIVPANRCALYEWPLSGCVKLSNFLQKLPKPRLGRDAHSSIRVQKPQPRFP